MTTIMRLARVSRTYGTGSIQVHALRAIDLVIDEGDFAP
jgi:hypothetical protein